MRRGSIPYGRPRGGIGLSILLCVSFMILCGGAGKTESFRFIFMTDIHVMEERGAAQGFRAAIARINSLHPDFVIAGGDLVFDACGVDYPRACGLYDLYAALCREIEAPVHDAIGNHDVFGLYESSGVNPDHPHYGRKLFAQRLGGGSTYSSFDYKGWHFILLDTVGFTSDRKYFGLVGLDQLEWITADLEKIDPAIPLVLVGHLPLVSVYRQYREGGAVALAPREVVINSHEVLARFEGYNLKLVLQGHLHVVEQIAVKGIHFVTGGAVCGSWWQGPYEGFPEGFVVIDIEGERFNYYYETYGWKAVP
ncbi:MAG: metallophosphoesterase [Candidatus Krumholzibacteriota bacterium]|nr:metallophosphoesterase [Candidatus Krumholzibacteriota bacterium]